nr:immunoglobulin heavy chain junction region [Macaca mulatta]
CATDRAAGPYDAFAFW